MKYSTRLTPPPSISARLAAALLIAALALTADAQISSVVLNNTGKSCDNPAANLTNFLNDTSVDSTVRELDIEARDCPATVLFGVGETSRCAYGAGGATQLVAFHNATGTYSHDQPIARACTYRGHGKCSRTVTIDGVSYTANRGSPPCPESWVENNMHVGAPSITGFNSNHPERNHTGMFTVRIYGKVCISRDFFCYSLKNFQPDETVLADLNSFGYFATFTPGGPNCGPATWPTPELQAAGQPSYAELCDCTFDIR